MSNVATRYTYLPPQHEGGEPIAEGFFGFLGTTITAVLGTTSPFGETVEEANEIFSGGEGGVEALKASGGKLYRITIEEAGE